MSRKDINGLSNGGKNTEGTVLEKGGIDAGAVIEKLLGRELDHIQRVGKSRHAGTKSLILFEECGQTTPRALCRRF